MASKNCISENTEVTLEEFVAECKDDADRFKAMWCKHRVENPEAFPCSMNSGDWFDQFMLFLNS